MHIHFTVCISLSTSIVGFILLLKYSAPGMTEDLWTRIAILLCIESVCIIVICLLCRDAFYHQNRVGSCYEMERCEKEEVVIYEIVIIAVEPNRFSYSGEEQYV